MTRAEFAKLLVGALGLALPDEARAASQLAAAFVDAEAIPAWAAPYVAGDAEKGYLQGIPAPGGVALAPARPVKRDEAAELLARVLGAEGIAPDGTDLTFADTDAIPDWAREGVAEAVAAGLLTGYPDGSFRPEAPLSRAEAAAMVIRLLGFRAAYPPAD